MISRESKIKSHIVLGSNNSLTRGGILLGYQMASGEALIGGGLGARTTAEYDLRDRSELGPSLVVGWRGRPYGGRKLFLAFSIYKGKARRTVLYSEDQFINIPGLDCYIKPCVGYSDSQNHIRKWAISCIHIGSELDLIRTGRFNLSLGFGMTSNVFSKIATDGSKRKPQAIKIGSSHRGAGQGDEGLYTSIVAGFKI